MNRRFLSTSLPLLLSATAVALPAVTAFAADQPAAAAPVTAAAKPQIDDAAMALLQKSMNTMKGLKTFRAEATTSYVFAPTEDGKQTPPSHLMETVVATKPNNMRYERWVMAVDDKGMWTKKFATPTTVVVSDGKIVWQQSGKTYRANPFKSAEQVTNGAPWQGFYSEKMSPYADVANEKAEGELIELSGMGSETVDGVACQKVFKHWKPSENKEADFKETYFIGPDNLVHHHTESIVIGKTSYTVEASIRNIKTNAPVSDGASLFAYAPPAGVTLFVPKPQPVLLVSGVAAPEITAVDKDGKTVHLSDFKGKVVVVDFWASWCPPCKASMPHNQEVTKKLQDAGVPMVLLAVDNSEEQPGFTKWVGEHSELSALQFVYVDPKTRQVCGDDYHVSGIPTQYILDKDGVIRASFVGYGGPTDDMEKAVRAAMQPISAKSAAATVPATTVAAR